MTTTGETHEILSSLWRSEKTLILGTKGKRYAIFSDIHLGDGGGADNFAPNIQALLTALDYYYNHHSDCLPKNQTVW
jgi:hypothetical protein